VVRLGRGQCSPGTARDLGSDGTPAAPLFVVDEGTPHALMIVPVPAGMPAGHAHAAK